jgi:hypothetical protein
MADTELPMLEAFLQDRPVFRALTCAPRFFTSSARKSNGLPKARVNAKALLREVGAIEAAPSEQAAA